VELLSIDTGRIDTLFLARENEVPFPAGRAIALGVASPGVYVGLTRPWEQPRGNRYSLPEFSRPKQGMGHLIIRAQAEHGWTAAARDVSLSLSGGGPEIRASTATNLAPAHYSVFYDVPAGTYSVHIQSEHWRLSIGEVVVKPDHVVFSEGARLLEKPNVAVEIVPEPWRVGPWTVTAYHCGSEQLGPGGWPDLAGCKPERQVKTMEDHAVLSGLDWPKVFVTAEASGHQAGRQVDLSDGKSATLQLEVRSGHIFGTVSRGGQPIQAEVTIEAVWPRGEALSTASASDGTYSSTLWAPGVYRVRARPPDQPANRASEVTVTVGRELEQRADIAIPSTDLLLRVIDKDTGQPIPGATVGWLESGSGRSQTADDLGEAPLPPLPSGPTRLRVAADGYRTEHPTFQVLETSEPQSFEQVLVRERPENSFTVLLPSGAPATMAQAFVCDPTGTTVTEAASCGSSGICQLAAKPADGQPIFVFDPQAALTVGTAGQTLAAGTVTLPPPGGELTIPVHRGTATATQTLALSIELGGYYIPDDILAAVAARLMQSYQVFLPAHSDPDAFRLQGLPQGTGSCTILARARGATTATAFLRASDVVLWQLPMQNSAPVELP
jgi:hypothetical protein